MVNYISHEVAGILPQMEVSDFDQLIKDIEVNGQLEPIWLDEDGKSIIDGRHRYLACKRLGIEPKFQTWNGKGDLVQFVLSLNLRRRHLSPSQAAMAARNALPLLQKYAKARSEGGVAVEANVGRATAQAGALYGASSRGVERAAVVSEKGVPELNAAVVSGEASVSAAAVVATNYTHEEQLEITAGGKAAITKAASAVRAAKKPALSLVVSEVVVAEEKAEYNHDIVMAEVYMAVSDCSVEQVEAVIDELKAHLADMQSKAA